MAPVEQHSEMFRAFGCHGELVQTDKEIKPALKRAIDLVRTKSKPAVVNCLTDPDVLHNVWMNVLGMGLFSFQPWEDVPEEARKRIIEEGLVPPWSLPLCSPDWINALLGAR